MTPAAPAAAACSFLSLKTQFGNVGDALINRELIGLLHAHGAVCVDTSGTPRWYVDGLALAPGTRRVDGHVRLLAALLRARLERRRAFFFFVPGGFSGELTRRQFVRRTLLLAPLALLRAIGVRICHVGVSYEAIGARHAAYLRLKQRLMHAFFVRDSRSAALLQRLGVHPSGVLPDLAFNLVAAAAGGSRGASPRRVEFSFRTDQHAAQFDRIDAAVRAVLDRLPADVDRGVTVQVTHDALGMRRLAERIGAERGTEFAVFTETRSVELLLAHYRAADLVVSNRLHVLLLAAAAGCRIVACVDPHNAKIVGLFESLGRTDVLLDLAASDAAAVDRALAAPPLDTRGERDALQRGIARLFAGDGVRVGVAAA